MTAPAAGIDADLAVQRIHVAEMAEQRAQAHVGAQGDLFHGRRDAALGDERGQCIDDLLARQDAAVQPVVAGLTFEPRPPTPPLHADSRRNRHE
jgi:hypothetical protein